MEVLTQRERLANLQKRNKELAAENLELREIVAEQADALVELAEIITEEE